MRKEQARNWPTQLNWLCIWPADDDDDDDEQILWLAGWKLSRPVARLVS